ncbi:MAG TPA: PTS sugar transporter subunit IIC [Longimicrobiaceae bacterium]|nr:PTS sugar transporter subunit IIC [Longimicrobiaceae bacterium]
MRELILGAPVTVVWLALFGGWTAIDSTSAGQVMISRPFAAATLAGWIAGDPVAGVVVGIVLEAFHLCILPVGAARNPEAGPASVVAGASYALAPHQPSVLLMAVAFALAWEWVSGESVRQVRQVNVRLVARDPEPRSRTIERRHLLAVLIDFARGVLLVVVGFVLLSLLLHLSIPRWGLGERIPHLVLGAVVVGLFASTLRFFGTRVKLFLAGAVVGLLLLRLHP